jgi:hypothetical protein
LGTVGGMTGITALCFLFLGTIMISQTTRTDLGTQKDRERWRKKQELGFRTQKDVSRSMGCHVKSGAKWQADDSGEVEIAEKQASLGHYL